MIEELNRLETTTFDRLQATISTKILELIDVEAKQIIRDAKNDPMMKASLREFESLPLKNIVYAGMRASVSQDDINKSIEQELNNIADEATKTNEQMGGTTVFTAAAATPFFVKAFADYYQSMLDNETIYKIPTSLTRDSLNIIAGAETVNNKVVRDTYGRITIDGQPSYGTLYATNDFVDLLPEPPRYEWVHRTSLTRAFEPHLALDGRRFYKTEASRFLANFDDNGRGSVFFPGDHKGCFCKLLLTT